MVYILAWNCDDLKITWIHVLHYYDLRLKQYVNIHYYALRLIQNVNNIQTMASDVHIWKTECGSAADSSLISKTIV